MAQEISRRAKRHEHLGGSVSDDVSLRSLCVLCASAVYLFIYHRDAEDAEAAQRLRRENR